MELIITENQKNKLKSLIYEFIDSTYGELDDDWENLVDVINSGGNSDEKGETFFNFNNDNFFIFYDCQYASEKFLDPSIGWPYIALSYPNIKYFTTVFPTEIFETAFKDWFEDHTGIRPNKVGE